jgi:hypothetical protein
MGREMMRMFVLVFIFFAFAPQIYDLFIICTVILVIYLQEGSIIYRNHAGGCAGDARKKAASL